ncbi:2203_t:CDS:2 [Funneliformis caledonium]|uniref:2203_t:CDS:1 n=1 Tax=Funneliformis caledonium TaxID=1117310 RepID=A0A9N9A7Y5_9GLOM|nr:2203_t:CDS:2 [Funneliformis caledonium]
MSNISQAENERPSVYSVAGIVLNILSAIKNNSIDAVNEIDVTTNEVEFNSDKFLEDTAVEQTLCAIWDLSSLEEYANILVNECQIHRIMLKLITSTARNRTKELSLGVLANLACFPDKAMILIGDMDLLNIIQVIIKDDENEDDVRVLFEASRKLFIAIINLMNILLETGLIPPDVFERNHGTLYQLQHRTKDEYSDEDGDDDEILNLIETFKNKIELSKKR